MIGKVLCNRYKIIEILNSSHMGQTYLAIDKNRSNFSKCVVKHLNPIYQDSQSLATNRRLFESEAKTLKRLGHHSQIPELLSYFEEDNEFYLIQEFISGHTLAEEIGS
ncbi:MAG: protein kinase, partial [Bacteroidota bacterium]